jgi:hypothetical protein
MAAFICSAPLGHCGLRGQRAKESAPLCSGTLAPCVRHPLGQKRAAGAESAETWGHAHGRIGTGMRGKPPFTRLAILYKNGRLFQ